MKRRAFVQSCLGSFMMIPVLTACEKESVTPDGEPLFRVNLDTELRLPDDFLQRKDVLVIRLAAGNVPESFAVLHGICPHAGGVLVWEPSSDRVFCPVHGSRFTDEGVVTTGPAAQNLKKYRYEINSNELLVWAM
jgi:Rieske Fe-S protein